MSLAHLLWSSTESTLSPMIFVLRFSNCGCRRAMYPSSVVHTGVKSFGCENRIAHPLPIHSWNLILPSVVSAVKSGTSSPMRNDMGTSGAIGVCCTALEQLSFLPTVPFHSIPFHSRSGPICRLLQARVLRNPVYFPGLAAIRRERLLEAA